MERSGTRRVASPLRRVTRLHLGVTTGALTLRRRDAEWRPLHVGLPGSSLTALAVAPEHSETLYAAAGDTIYLTSDGGAHWRRLGTPSPGITVSSLLALPKPRGSLVAGLGPAGVARSEDSGRTWRLVSLPDLPPGVVSQLLLAPGEQPIIYAVAAGVILSSGDAGQTWQALSALRASVSSLAIHPDAPATLFAGSPSGLFRTRNGGRNWQRMHGEPVMTLLIHPARPRTLLAAFPEGLAQSANAGAGWQAMPGAESQEDDPVRVLVGHGPGEIVLAATTSGRLLELRDGVWREPKLGPTPPVTSIVVATTELAKVTTAPKRSQPRRRRPPQREGTAPAGRPASTPTTR